MNSEIPKPFISIKGKTVLEYTLSCFTGIPRVKQIIIPVSNGYLGKAENLVRKYRDSVEIICIEGGRERQFSIMNAIRHLRDVDLVSVHDAVRPFVSKEAILKGFNAAMKYGASVVGIRARDTIKKSDSNGIVLETLDRLFIWECQTPQTFQKDLFLSAYKKARELGFLGTDDASVIEHYGASVHMVEGNPQNIKLTYPFDIQLAEFIIDNFNREK